MTDEQRARYNRYHREHQRMLRATDPAYRCRNHVASLTPERAEHKRALERERTRRHRERKRAAAVIAAN